MKLPVNTLLYKGAERPISFEVVWARLFGIIDKNDLEWELVVASSATEDAHLDASCIAIRMNGEAGKSAGSLREAFPRTLDHKSAFIRYGNSLGLEADRASFDLHVGNNKITLRGELDFLDIDATNKHKIVTHCDVSYLGIYTDLVDAAAIYRLGEYFNASLISNAVVTPAPAIPLVGGLGGYDKIYWIGAGPL